MRSGWRRLSKKSAENACQDLQSWPHDDPFDPEFGSVFFSLSGVTDDGLQEHIADRASYVEAVSLAQKLVPGIQFADPL
jgi:hypothetical protein